MRRDRRRVFIRTHGGLAIRGERNGNGCNAENAERKRRERVSVCDIVSALCAPFCGAAGAAPSHCPTERAAGVSARN